MLSTFRKTGKKIRKPYSADKYYPFLWHDQIAIDEAKRIVSTRLLHMVTPFWKFRYSTLGRLPYFALIRSWRNV